VPLDIPQYDVTMAPWQMCEILQLNISESSGLVSRGRTCDLLAGEIQLDCQPSFV
jgi:hypothetical protein